MDIAATKKDEIKINYESYESTKLLTNKEVIVPNNNIQRGSIEDNYCL